MPSPASTAPSCRRSTWAVDRRDVHAVLISDDRRKRARSERWERQLPDVPLVIVESPYRALVGPLLAYLDVLDQTWPPSKRGADHVRRRPRVRRPPLVGAHPLQPVGQSTARALLGRPHTVVVNVPYRREDGHDLKPQED